MVFRHFPLRDAMKQIKAYGFDEMEVTIAGLFTPHFLHLAYLTESEMKEKAEEAASYGIHVHALNVGAGYTPQNESEVRQCHLQALRLAYAYQAEVVTVGCGGIAEGTDTIQGLQKIADYLNVLSLIAWNEYGIRLSVEAPHRGTISEKLAQIKTYWAYMPERVCCTMDVAHIMFAGNRVEDVLQIVGNRLAHVHLRDAVIGNSMVPYGEGKVDFASVFRLLEKYDYQGKCSLEFPAGEKMDDAIAAFKKGIQVLNSQREASEK
jgi:sugar phosphate isomerase/epimerase